MYINTGNSLSYQISERSADILKNYKSDDPICSFPHEIILLILSQLNDVQLTKNEMVCRAWKMRGKYCYATLWDKFNLRTISPLIKVFDENDWITHFSSLSFEVADAPPFDKRTVIQTLKRSLFSLPIEGNAGITFLTIPKGLRFTDLTFEASLCKKKWNPLIRTGSLFVEEVLREYETDKTYRIGITNSILIGSRNLKFCELRERVIEMGYDMPTGLEVTALLLALSTVSKEYPYSGVDTVCSDNLPLELPYYRREQLNQWAQKDPTKSYYYSSPTYDISLSLGPPCVHIGSFYSQIGNFYSESFDVSWSYSNIEYQDVGVGCVLRNV